MLTPLDDTFLTSVLGRGLGPMFSLESFLSGVENFLGGGTLEVFFVETFLLELLLIGVSMEAEGFFSTSSTGFFDDSTRLLIEIFFSSAGDAVVPRSREEHFLGEVSGVSWTRKFSGLSLDVSIRSPDVGLSMLSPGE